MSATGIVGLPLGELFVLGGRTKRRPTVAAKNRREFEKSLGPEDLGTFRAAYESAREMNFDVDVSLLAGKRAVARTRQRRGLEAGTMTLTMDNVPLLGRWKNGSMSIVSDHIEVFESSDIPVAVFTSRFPAHEGAEFLLQNEVEEFFGARLLMGVWTKLDSKEAHSDLPAPSFDCDEVWVARCDGFAPDVEE